MVFSYLFMPFSYWFHTIWKHSYLANWSVFAPLFSYVLFIPFAQSTYERRACKEEACCLDLADLTLESNGNTYWLECKFTSLIEYVNLDKHCFLRACVPKIKKQFGWYGVFILGFIPVSDQFDWVWYLFHNSLIKFVNFERHCLLQSRVPKMKKVVGVMWCFHTRFHTGFIPVWLSSLTLSSIAYCGHASPR